jgi:hypothetical protein
MEKEVVNKLEVAERQLIEAISLFFEKRDKVTIHTIVASTHQVLFDVAKISNVESALKNTSALSKKEIREHLKSINYPYNFFKHADCDADSKINIGPLSRFTQDFIMDAVLMLQNLKGTIPVHAKIFWFWFVSEYPEEFSNLPPDGEIAKFQKENLASWSFEDISQFIKFCEIAEIGST